jgi:hypothetical protein
MLYIQQDALPCTNRSFTKVNETDCLRNRHRCNFHILVMKANIPIKYVLLSFKIISRFDFFDTLILLSIYI